jgi:hypothetical protein
MHNESPGCENLFVTNLNDAKVEVIDPPLEEGPNFVSDGLRCNKTDIAAY